MKIQSNTSNSGRPAFGMKFTEPTMQLAKDVSSSAYKIFKESEASEKSANYIVHIVPPESKSLIKQLFTPKGHKSNYWQLCVSNPTEFPELGDTFYQFLAFTKNNNINKVSDVFVADFFVKEHAYNALRDAAKRVANVEHPSYPNPSREGRMC